jgi:hypothetical protein
MKRIGIALLVIGLVAFVLASSKRGGYDSVEGALKSTFSSSERSKKDTWETLRWVGLAAAGVGLVMVLLPGGKT